MVERISADGEFFGYAVDGRFADAVRFGLLHLGKDDPFDLVVSGINQGANVGDVSHLSGTVGAAMEAIYQGVPAIAVSQDTANVDTAVTVNLTRQLVAKYQREGAPKGIVISINVPGGELKGVAVRPMGESYLKFSPYELTRTDGEVSQFETAYVGNRALESSNDTYAYQNGYATITPLKFDWTAHEMLSEVEAWGLTLD
jgi:5'-nucleotidase